MSVRVQRKPDRYTPGRDGNHRDFFVVVDDRRQASRIGGFIIVRVAGTDGTVGRVVLRVDGRRVRMDSPDHIDCRIGGAGKERNVFWYGC